MSTTEKVKNNIGKSSHILFAFDTTGSMSPCIADVRTKLKMLASEMMDDIPDLKIAVISHGDYCDGVHCIKTLDFTNDLDEILTFLHNSPNTSGGDAEECYELVLHEAGKLSWPETGGSVVMLGDDAPHSVGYMYGEIVNQLDWKIELETLLSKNIKVFPIQCLGRQQIHFWRDLAELSNTTLLEMNDFSDTAVNLGAVAYASTGRVEALDAYGAKYRACSSSDFSDNISKLSNYVKGEDG